MKAIESLRALFASHEGDEVGGLEALLAEAEARQRTAAALLGQAQADEARALAGAVLDGADATRATRAREVAESEARQADALAAGLRDRLRQARDAAAAKAEAERQADRERLAVEYRAAMQTVDAAFVAAGGALERAAAIRAQLWDLRQTPCEAPPTLRAGTVDRLASLQVWKGSGGRFGAKLPLSGRDDSMAYRAFVAVAERDVYQLAGLTLPAEVAA
jgi:hypothetical protein